MKFNNLRIKMKLWFFARNTNQEYLYVQIPNNNANEIGFNIKEIKKIKIQKLKVSLFTEFHKLSSYNIFLARVDVRGTKYYIIEKEEIILKESSFFTKDMLKKLPIIESSSNNTNIIKKCYTKWRELK